MLRAQLKAQPKAKSGAHAHSKAAPDRLLLEDSYALAPTGPRLPVKHPGRGDLRNILVRLAKAVSSVQGVQSGAFWQVLDAPKRGKNYLRRAYRGLLDKFVSPSIFRWNAAAPDIQSGKRDGSVYSSPRGVRALRRLGK